MPRRHDIDALRVLAFGLLILYHVGMFYVAEWEWHVKSVHQSETLQAFMLVVNRWRMPLLFLISGLAIGLSTASVAPGRFAARRTLRLLLPLAFGMVAVVPIQAYCQGVSNGLVAPGFGDFLVRYLQFQPWPEGAFDGWDAGITWNHLWYLAYLWVYTIVLMALLPLFRSGRLARLRERLDALRGWGLVLWPLLPLVAYMLVLLPRFPATNDLVSDGFQHALFFTVFLIGFLIARAEGLWREITERRRRHLALAAGTFALYLPLLMVLPEEPPESALVLARVLRALYLWSALLAILGYAHAHLNRPFRWLPYATEAVYPWYVLHQSLIVLIGYTLTPYALGPVLEPLAVIAGTVIGCAVLHEFVIRRVALLRPLFGLEPANRVRRRDAAPAGESA